MIHMFAGSTYKRLNVSALLFLLFLLTLAGCSNAPAASQQEDNTNSEQPADQTETAARGGVLKIISGPMPRALGHPADIISRTETLLSAPAVETLGRYTETGDVAPHLAESWEEDQAAKTITLKLRTGIEFHDGTPFNAEAVKWNLDQYRIAKKPVFNETDTYSIEVIDEHTVQITLADWNVSMINVIAVVPMTSQAAFETQGKDAVNLSPVGTGPFIMEEWNQGQSISFKKNENYWQEGLPKLEGIQFDFIEEPMTAEAAMQKGDYDILLEPSASTVKNLAGQFDILKLENGIGSAGVHLAFNTVDLNSPYRDIKVRQAVGHAIDIKAIINTIYGETVVQTNQWAASNAWTYNPDVKGLEYNPEKAKALLKEAGYEDGFTTDMTYAQSEADTQMMTAVQGYLADVGIKLKLNPVDGAKFTSIRGPDGGWDGIIKLTSKMDTEVPTVLNIMLGSNGFMYKSIEPPKALDDLLEQSATAKNLDELKNYTHQLQKLITDEQQLTVNMFISSMPIVKTNNVQGTGLNQTHAAYWSPETATR